MVAYIGSFCPLQTEKSPATSTRDFSFERIVFLISTSKTTPRLPAVGRLAALFLSCCFLFLCHNSLATRVALVAHRSTLLPPPQGRRYKQILDALEELSNDIAVYTMKK